MMRTLRRPATAAAASPAATVLAPSPPLTPHVQMTKGPENAVDAMRRPYIAAKTRRASPESSFFKLTSSLSAIDLSARHDPLVSPNATPAVAAAVEEGGESESNNGGEHSQIGR